MRITIWKGGSLVDSRDLQPRVIAGKPRVEYKGELYYLQCDSEIWLDGIPPNRDSQGKKQAAPVPLRFSALISSANKISTPSNHVSTADGTPQTASEAGKSPQPPSGTTWNQDQWDIISAPASARILVNACPGSGKTAAACARVAHLIEQQNCNPDGIWLLSFTRIAVAEIHDRIARYLKARERATQAHLASLDSFAWQLNKGFDSNATLKRNFEENIRNAIALIGQSAELQEWLGSLAHLVVDEAQDIVGSRAQLLACVLKFLGPECGVTILSDDAQAIYGFTSETAGRTQSGAIADSAPLPDIIRSASSQFAVKSLGKVYRAGGENLQELFTGIRSEILNDTFESPDSWRMIWERVKAKAHTSDESGFEPQQLGLESAAESQKEIFALFRSKKEVFHAAATIPDNLAFRIHCGGVKRALPVWLGAISLICRPPCLYYQDLEQELANRPGLFPENVWRLLGGRAGARYLKLSEIDDISEYTIDPRMLKKELGMCGPLLGTIHASKGREADYVHLYLSETPRRDYREECRVVFVGASRARKLLAVHDGLGNAARREKAAPRFTLGLDEEINPAMLAGRDVYPTQPQACQRQEALRELAIRFLSKPAPEPARAVLQGKRYELQTEGGQPLCFLDESGSQGLRSYLERGIAEIDNIRIMDIVACKAEEGVSLHDPWKRCRFLLKPRIFAYPAC